LSSLCADFLPDQAIADREHVIATVVNPGGRSDAIGRF
jgi:hypothetical protein